MINIDLNSYREAPDSFGEMQLLLTVKSFNLQAIRKRYLASRKRSRSGSIKRREPAQGGLVYLKIRNGRIEQSKILAQYKEARGIDFKKKQLAISSEDEIFIFDIEHETMDRIQHPWLAYIHTVKFNHANNQLLVASSGVDTILEFDLQTRKKTWEWNAWEHGINQGLNPKDGKKHYLTRSVEEAEQLKKAGKNVILINHPQKDKLPTALRAAFINSAEYDHDGNILLTFFHDGDVKQLDKKSNRLPILISGFEKPHGGMACQAGYLVTDTAGGRVFQQKKETGVSYFFHNLEGKDPRLKALEWLQTSHFHRGNIITIDSNRTSLVAFNPQKELRMMLPYDPNWAVQDFIPFTGAVEKIEKSIQSMQ